MISSIAWKWPFRCIYNTLLRAKERTGLRDLPFFNGKAAYGKMEKNFNSLLLFFYFFYKQVRKKIHFIHKSRCALIYQRFCHGKIDSKKSTYGKIFPRKRPMEAAQTIIVPFLAICHGKTDYFFHDHAHFFHKKSTKNSVLPGAALSFSGALSSDLPRGFRLSACF